MSEKVLFYRAACRAPATLTAYASDWKDFTRWCEAVGVAALPAAEDTVAAYLAERAGMLRPTTLERRVMGILFHHRRAGFAFDPHAAAIADTLGGIRRVHGTAPRQKAPLSTEEIRDLVTVLPDTLTGRRDRAILLIAFAAALRRSEVAGLRTDDVSFVQEGILIRIRRAKEDQEGASSVKAVPFGVLEATCPVRALKKWVAAARLDGGPLFRRLGRDGIVKAEGLSGATVAVIVKRTLALAGRRAGWTEDRIADQVASVSGHSLRAGFVTSAAARGVPEWAIQRQTGHRCSKSMRRYIRIGAAFTKNRAGDIGL